MTEFDRPEGTMCGWQDVSYNQLTSRSRHQHTVSARKRQMAVAASFHRKRKERMVDVLVPVLLLTVCGQAMSEPFFCTLLLYSDSLPFFWQSALLLHATSVLWQSALLLHAVSVLWQSAILHAVSLLWQSALLHGTITGFESACSDGVWQSLSLQALMDFVSVFECACFDGVWVFECAYSDGVLVFESACSDEVLQSLSLPVLMVF